MSQESYVSWTLLYVAVMLKVENMLSTCIVYSHSGLGSGMVLSPCCFWGGPAFCSPHPHWQLTTTWTLSLRGCCGLSGHSRCLYSHSHGHTPNTHINKTEIKSSQQMYRKEKYVLIATKSFA